MLSIVVTLFGFYFATIAQQPNYVQYNTPKHIHKCVQSDRTAGWLKIVQSVNPFYLRGDFNGDNLMDYAVLVQDLNSKKKGIAICHAQSNDPLVLGPRIHLQRSDGYVYEEFNVEAWQVHPKMKRIPKTVDEGPPPELQGDAILVIWPERGSGLIFWDGKKYLWYHQDF